MYRSLLFLFFVQVVLSCQQPNDPEVTPAVHHGALTDLVDPFIGTGGHGHTYPGASLPFGMMQLSPDTRLDGWDGCSGYHYSDEYTYGFSHTHLSGTGVSDYGDILLMPTDSLVFHNGADGKPGYRAHFSHDNETASPGYYRVLLDSTGIEVELTVGQRSGIHRYSYPGPENQHLILDLEHRDMLLDYGINTVSDHEISGFRRSKAWAEDQHLYFYIRFSHPFESPTYFHRDPDRRNRMGGYTFVNPNNEPILAYVGISAVDIEGAKKNMEEETGQRSFEEVRQEASTTWENHLGKIVVETDKEDDLVNFYSAMYHLMLAPNLYQDADGRYRGMDLEVHQSDQLEYYTVFSLWDTYRAAHPLFTIIDTERTNHFIRTFNAKYKEGGIMPIWDLAGNYTGCMIGYHAVPVIADAYLKGIRDYDTELAFEAMKHSAMQDKLGLEAFKSINYIPVEQESESVSKTLEYAYDDWTIAEMARAMGKEEEASYFDKRALAYKNVFDPQTGFMRGRINNQWFAPFDPYEVNFNYTEANAWQYSTYVPQDIDGLIELHGGKKGLEAHLDRLFTATQQTSGRDQADITGLIGQYAHGNEPSHHMAYLYNFVNRPDKTQKYVRQILRELYTPTPDGISGNEDCGQMSAWYVLSSLGFYPVTPGSNQYVIGTPLFEKASINLENGNVFTVVAKGASEGQLYVADAKLNGEPLGRTYLYHREIMEGGLLEFELSEEPSSWGTTDGEVPGTSINSSYHLPVPFISSGKLAFKDSTVVELGSVDAKTKIHYRLSGGDYTLYENPITISNADRLEVYGSDGVVTSDTVSTEFRKIDPTISIALGTAYANQYNGGGQNALIDGIRGGSDFRTGAWQGYQDKDLLATIDLGSMRTIAEVSVGFLQDQRSWIFFPTELLVEAGEKPESMTTIGSISIEADKADDESRTETFSLRANGQSARYIRVTARNLGDLPSWHLGAPSNGKAWIFVDEITIKTKQ